MSVAGNARFACEECGKSYAWKPELAGKRAKCKCGRLMEVPASPPEPETPPEPSFDDLYALAEQASAQAAAPAAVPVAAPAAKPRTKSRAPAAAAGVGMYASSRRDADAAKSAASAQIMDLYVPIGLLVFGSALCIWRIMASSEMSIVAATAFLGVWMMAEAVLVFLGCLVGIKWLGISLGDPLTALLKIGAVVVGPFGVALAVSWLTGTWLVGFFLAPLLYYALLSVFFEMDLGEVLMLSGVIYVLQYAGRLLLLLTLLRAVFGEVPPAVAQIAGMALFGPGIGSLDDGPDATIVQKNSAADDKLTDDMIKEDRYTMDIDTFWVNPKNGFAGMKREEADALYQDLRARGAVKVMGNQISGYAARDFAQYTALLMIVELPADPSARKALFEKYNQIQPPRGYKEARDIGQKYLRIWVLPKQDKNKPAPVEEEEAEEDDNDA